MTGSFSFYHIDYTKLKENCYNSNFLHKYLTNTSVEKPLTNNVNVKLLNLKELSIKNSSLNTQNDPNEH